MRGSVLNNGQLRTSFSGKNRKYTFDEEGVTQYRDYQFDYGYQRFVYNREMIVQNSILFPNYRRSQDPPFFVKAMIVAEEFYSLDVPTYVYSCNGTIKSCDKEKVLGILYGLSDNLHMAKENSLWSLYELTLLCLAEDCRSRIEESLTRKESETYNKMNEIYVYVSNSGMKFSKQLELIEQMLSAWQGCL